jgi:hypothetical protein
MVSNKVSLLLSKLQTDAWRVDAGFSPEVDSVNHALFKADISDAEIVAVLNEWMQKHQPCLFGRIAAKRGLISYCILTDSDLEGTDETISEKIGAAHTLWSREGFEGSKSAFVLAAVSSRIAYAEPNATTLELAKTLCSFLLMTDIKPDRIYLDELLLELPTTDRLTWRWDVGVNYFSAHGDVRWWNDHRIPGGMAFSTNSVGHMVKSGKLALAIREIEEIMGLPQGSLVNTPVDSLEKALEMAMRTIHNASNATSGKATELLPLPTDPSELPVASCPIKLPADLVEKNFCEYLGRYHTDYTIPSEYFLPDVERPANLKTHVLDFTYLFDDSIYNPDFVRMGEGRRIRTDNADLDDRVDRLSKRGKGVGEPIVVSDEELRAKGLR